MIGLTANMSIEAAEPVMIEKLVRLFTGAIVAMVPLSFGGAVLFAFFQLAGE